MTGGLPADRTGLHLSWNYARYIASYTLQFITSVILARFLEPLNYGVYVRIFAVAGFLSLITSLGLEGTALILLPKTRQAGRGAVADLVRTVIIVRLVAFGVIVGALFSAYCLGVVHFAEPAFGSHTTLAVVLCCILAFGLGLTDLFSAFLNGLFQFGRLFKIEVSVSLAVLIVVGGMAYRGASIASVLVTVALAKVVSCGVYAWAFRDQLRVQSGFSCLKRVLRSSASLYAVRLLQFAVGVQKDVILIGMLLFDASQVAFYAIAVRVTEMLSSSLTLGFGEVAQPHFSRVAESKDLGLIGDTWRQFMSFQIVMAMPPIGFALAQGAKLLVMVYSTKYMACGRLIDAGAALLFVSTAVIGGGVSNKVIYALEKNHVGLTLISLAGAVNVTLLVVLIQRYGILGAVLATGLSHILWRATELFYVLRILRVHFPWTVALRTLACTIPAIILSRGLELSFVAGTLTYMGVFGAMALWLKPVDDGIVALASGSPRIVQELLRTCSRSTRAMG